MTSKGFITIYSITLRSTGTNLPVAGSDYPHQIGSLEMMIKSIDKLEISRGDKSAIYGGNALTLLDD